MPSSMTKISSVTVGSGGASSISFSAIPATYTDLYVKLSLRSDRTADTDSVNMTVNGSATSMTWLYLLGNNSSVSSATAQRFYTDSDFNTASTFGSADVYIPNYASANYKSFSVDTVSENLSANNAQTELLTQLWSNTAAITSITFAPQFGSNWKQYSTATLYGVTKYAETGTGSKAIGGTVTTAGGYTYHTFFSSGMFTPTAAITGAEVLVVAGGGGTGDSITGGGGAGGLVYASGQSYSSGVGYTAIVGAGGARSTVSNVVSPNGTNSSFASGTVAIGGGGGGSLNQSGAAGGSGGGGGASNGSGGGATAGQGNIGGSTGTAYGGGGGGAGAAGGTSTGSVGGAGGNGESAYSAFGAATGTGQNIAGTYWYAGGGGGCAWNGVSSTNIGGQGGKGGGGQGGDGGGPNTTTPTDGLPFTGGGAGGSNSTGRIGGSGIVIVRYTT
jgi:hypothetical protein